MTYEEDDFVMLKVKISPTSINLDPNQAWVQIEYSADSPDPNVWSSGRIRLWKKPGDQPRDNRSALPDFYAGEGDWIAPGLYTDLGELTPSGTASHEMTFYIEGVNPSGTLGDTDITFWLDPDGPGPAGYVHADTVQVTVIRLGLDVDTDRDGTVDHLLDESRKDEITRDRGALFMTNYDDDDGFGVDAIGFSESGSAGNENTVIEAGDVPDIGHLVVRAPGLAITGLQFFLRMNADHLKAVHIFEQRAEGKHVLTTSGGANWPGWAAQSGASGDSSLDITALVNPTQDVDLGIESLFLPGYKTESPWYEFEGQVKVELVVQLTTGATAVDPTKILKIDTVRLAVAPYLLLPNTQACQGAWLIDRLSPTDPAPWLPANPLAAALGTLAHRAVCPEGQWFQDHVQVGMTAIPGSQMHLTVQMPYLPSQPGWPLFNLRGPQRGLYRFRNTCTHDGADSGDFGGNLEIIPYSDDWPLGRIIVGNTMSTPLRSFLEAQRIAGTEPVQKPILADTSWLAVGHIDEIMCPVPGGQSGYKVMMASPDYAYQLLTTGDSARGIAAPSEDTAVFVTGAQASGTASNAIQTVSMTWLFDGAAHGSIFCIGPGAPGTGVSDGETVTISDGATTKVFEFDTNGSVSAGHVQINIAGATDDEDVRDALQSAIAAAGMGLTPYADLYGSLIIINNALGTAGNIPITETVAAPGFTVEGMSGGEAPPNGRDFTGSTWKWIRLFDGTGAGQVGRVDLAGVGFIRVGTGSSTYWAVYVYNTSSRIADPSGLAGIVLGTKSVPRSDHWYYTEPDYTTRYVLAQDCRDWLDHHDVPFPAIITVHEILNDNDLYSLNTAAQARINEVRDLIRTSMGSGYLMHDYTSADDSLYADADDDFIALPVIFFGPSATLGTRENAAFTPGLANGLALHGAKVVLPAQFGARSGGVDVFEKAAEEIMRPSPDPSIACFADDWDGYHRFGGEVHCASGEVRTLFSFNWWEHQP